MSNLENFDIKSHVIESIVEVFDTMVSMQIEHSDSEPQDTGDAGRVVVAVNFSGNVAGILNIQIPTDFARLMTANKLDMKPEELEGDGAIKDLLSEIIIIVGGNLKSALNDAGINCVLSTPSMTYEGDFTIKSLNMERFERFVFMHQQDWIFVEVGLNAQPGAEDGEEDPHEREAGEVEPVSETLNQSEIDAVPSEADASEPQEPPGPLPAAQQIDQSPTAAPAPKSSEDVDLDLLLDIPLEIKVELGRAKIQIQELLKLAPGSAVKLIKLEGEPVDILANETLIARGEVVVQKEKYGIRVTEITTRLDRIRSFGR
jgi:flagellar motor switch protein FliN